MIFFNYTYKKYNDCPLASMLNKFCSAIAKMCLILGILLLAVIVIDTPENYGEGLIGLVILALGYIILRFFKDKWSDNLAQKERERNLKR